MTSKKTEIASIVLLTSAAQLKTPKLHCSTDRQIFGLRCRMMTRRKQLKMHPSDSKINHWKLCRKKKKLCRKSFNASHLFTSSLAETTFLLSWLQSLSLALQSLQLTPQLSPTLGICDFFFFYFLFFCCKGVFLPQRRWRWLSVRKLDLQKQIQGFLRQLVLTRNHNGRVSRSELGFLSCFHVT